MEHNYQKIRVSFTYGEEKKGEDKKIDWSLEVLKKGKNKWEELIRWFSKETEWPDAKLLACLLRDQQYVVLNMKSEREGLKNFSMFIVKDIHDVPFEVIMDDKVKEIFDNLPDVNNGMPRDQAQSA